jgi:hypothetical protein
MTTKLRKEAAAPKAKPRDKISKTVRYDVEHIRRAEAAAREKGIDFSAYAQMALAEKLERESNLKEATLIARRQV